MKQKGFTIVEIIITVTVIGILAAIAIVSYNGITQRANNAQTVEAVRQWAEALQTYEAEHPNELPAGIEGSLVCLGQNYPYGYDGQGTSGGQCLNLGEEEGSIDVAESGPLNTAMQDYFDGGIPNPSFQASQFAEGGGWVRGIIIQDGMILFLQKAVQDCPEVGNTRSIPSDELGVSLESGLLCGLSWI